MRFTKSVESWVVYQAVAKRGGGRAVCPDSEWPALEAAGHTLIQAGLVGDEYLVEIEADAIVGAGAALPSPRRIPAAPRARA